MSEGSAIPDQPLEGWDAIAGYLEVNKRTAQIWEKDLSLPVRRTRTGRVYAFAEDLRKWRPPAGPSAEAQPANPAPPSTPAPPISPELDSPPARRKLILSPWLLIGAPLLAAAVISFSFHIALASHRIPAAFRLDGNTLIVEDASGAEPWKRDFPDGFWGDFYGSGALGEGPFPAGALARRAWFGDLDGNGQTEMLFLYHPATRARSSSSLAVPSASHRSAR